MSHLVEEYGIGLTANPCEISEIAACLERMRDDAALRRSSKEGLKEAKGDLCWEREQAVLRDAYREGVRVIGSEHYESVID